MRGLNEFKSSLILNKEQAEDQESSVHADIEAPESELHLILRVEAMDVFLL